MRRERNILARREDAVGKWEIEDWGLVKRKDVVRTVLQSGPLRLQAEEDRIVETLCYFSNVMDIGVLVYNLRPLARNC